MASAGHHPSTALQAVGAFLLWLLLVLSLCLLAYLLIDQRRVAHPASDDPLGRREAQLEDKLRRLLSPVLAAQDFEIVVRLTTAGDRDPEGAVPSSDAVAETVQGQAGVPKVVILLAAQPDVEALEPVIRDLVTSALSGADLRIIRQVFRPQGDIRDWLPASPLLQLMVAAALAIAAALVLLGGYRSPSPRSMVRTEELGLDFQSLHNLSKQEPRRVANVLSQWMSQDDA